MSDSQMPDAYDRLLGALHGLPDEIHTKPSTIRVVQSRRFENREPEHWTNHAHHVIPVEGCHLCRFREAF